jgi:hypothetical protein
MIELSPTFAESQNRLYGKSAVTVFVGIKLKEAGRDYSTAYCVSNVFLLEPIFQEPTSLHYSRDTQSKTFHIYYNDRGELQTAGTEREGVFFGKNLFGPCSRGKPIALRVKASCLQCRAKPSWAYCFQSILLSREDLVTLRREKFHGEKQKNFRNLFQGFFIFLHRFTQSGSSEHLQGKKNLNSL